MSYYKYKIEQEKEQTKLSTQISFNEHSNSFLIKMDCALEEIDFNEENTIINSKNQCSYLISPKISYVGGKELLDSISELCI